MVDMTFIAAAMSSLKVAKDIGESMIGLRDAQAFQQKRLEFQSAIIDAQNAALQANDERSSLVQAVTSLKEKIAQLEAWEADKTRYELKSIERSNVLAYALKESMSNGEPTHYICAQCYQQGKKRILQPETRNPGRCEVYVCNECGSALYVDGGWQPEHSKRGR